MASSFNGPVIKLTRVTAFGFGVALLMVGYLVGTFGTQDGASARGAGSSDSSTHAGGSGGAFLATKPAGSTRKGTRGSAGPDGADSSCTAQSTKQLEFPEHITKLIINVGSYKDPPAPPDDQTAVIAVEPLLQTASQIPKTKDLYILTTAVSNYTGIAQFHVYNGGASSSLSRVTDPTQSWAQHKVNVESQVLRADDTPFFIVPVITLRQLLAAIPTNVKISYLKLDMQGYDYTAALSAGDLLRRAKKVQAEVYCQGYESYAGVHNRAEDWIPYMKKLGFEEIEGGCGGAGEADIIWKRVGTWP